MPDSVLVSASSSDIEFRAWSLRSSAECLGNPVHWGSVNHVEDYDHPCFSLYRVPKGAGYFYLVNGGFPVNFDGGIDPISPSKIQLTRSLLYMGAVQASRTLSPGLHQLDAGLQNVLATAWSHQSSKTLRVV